MKDHLLRARQRAAGGKSLCARRVIEGAAPSLLIEVIEVIEI